MKLELYLDFFVLFTTVSKNDLLEKKYYNFLYYISKHWRFDWSYFTSWIYNIFMIITSFSKFWTLPSIF